jgi:hypothetical protein
VNARLPTLALVIVLTAVLPASGLSRRRAAAPSPGSTLVAGGCAVASDACGFPDATDTGVPKGMSLRAVPGQVSSGPGWYYDAGGWVEVDHNGAVLTGLTMACNLDISASHVTIKDVQVEAGGANSFGITLRHTSGVTIEDSTIEGENTGTGRLMVGVKDVYGDSTGLRVLDNNISRVSTGVQVAAGLVQGNYIHDMGFMTGDHVNGVTVSGGITPLIVKHNTILVNRRQTDAISLFQDTQVEANKVIEHNLLAGGGYAIYGGEAPGRPAASHIVIVNNQISRIYYPSGGFYGPVAYFTTSGPGDVWSGNAWANSGRVIPGP